MFAKDSEKNSGLDELIDKIQNSLIKDKISLEEEAKVIGHLVKLYELKEANSKKHVSPDTKAIVAGNLLGILLILKHEQVNVVTSKALSFVLKLR